MSLAYKLWKIGSVLNEEDVQNVIRVGTDFKDGAEPVYLNIDFTFEGDEIANISLNKNSISEDNLFFSRKIGGTSNAYYLYPNIAIQKDKTSKGFKNIKNTLKYSTMEFCDDKNIDKIKKILDKLDGLEKEYELNNYPKGDYIIWVSLNGRTFYEIMPEVWDNFYKSPFTGVETKKGFDIFTNQETDVGYKTDFKVFSYDQYHDSLSYRIDENLPLSKESARYIKYAWMYILNNLVFYYKGLEYITIPNIITDDKKMLRMVIDRLVKANNKLSEKRTVIESLKQQEVKLKKQIEKHLKENKKPKNLEGNIHEVEKKIEQTDLGLIRELNEQVQTLEELVNSVTLDYIFVTINRTNLSFEINGTIEDVLPSCISNVVKKMKDYNIEDLVKLGSKRGGRTYLQDYFGRDELYFALNRSSKENANSIKAERISLAKILLTNIKIKHSDLLQKFEYNRSYGYDKKKRLTKEGVQEWIQYSNKFVTDEQNLLNFFNILNKIKEA